MRNTAKAVLTVSLLAGVLSGCAAPESTPTGLLPEAAVDMVTYSGSYPDQLWRVSTAEGKLTERCLRAAGFTWTSDIPPPARHGHAEALADARGHGYRMSDPPRSPADEKRTAQTEDPHFRVAMLGPENDLAQLTIDGHAAYWFPRTGCAARSRTAIYGSLDTWARISYFPQELNFALGDQARSDHRYLSALQKWRECMALHQHAYDSPTEIVDKLAEKYRDDHEPLEQRRAAEIMIAVQDVTCDQQAELTSTADALRREYAQKLSAGERAELTRLTLLFAQARQRVSE